MDVEKTSKEQSEILDINDVMNRLINKVSLVVQDEAPAEKKDLVEIRDILSELVDVDKTLTYNMLPETVANVRKAIQSIRVTDPERLKELNEIVQPLQAFEKLDENDVPTSDAEKREKFNEVVNTQLEQTIKTINEVILIVDANEKANIEVPKGELGVDKIVTEVFVSILADRLKAINEVFLPEDAESKNTEEVELNAERINKNTRAAYSDTQKRLKQFLGLDVPEQEPEKENPTAFEQTEVEEKQVQRIGTFPDLRLKSQQTIGDAAEIIEKEIPVVPDEQAGDEKQFSEVQDAELPDNQNGLLKSEQQLGDASAAVDKEFDPFTEQIEAPDQEDVKSEQEIQQADEGDEKSLNEIDQAAAIQKDRYDFDNTTTFRKGQDHSEQEGFEYVPKPDFQADGGSQDVNQSLLISDPQRTEKTTEDIDVASQRSNKTTTPIAGSNFAQGAAKASRGDMWYEQLFSPAGNEVGIFANGVGVSYDPINQSAQAVGAALAFFSLNVADVTRYLNKQIRTINTSTSSIAITSQLLLIQAQRGSGVTPEGDLYKSKYAEANIDTAVAVYDAEIYKLENNKQLASEANEQAVEQIISEYEIQSKAADNESEVTDVLSNAIRDLSFIRKDTIAEGDTLNPLVISKFPAPEDDPVYSEWFRERTEAIEGIDKRVSGFIKVFNKRSPRFSQGDAINQILPFQFEPIITGDSKAAEYSGVPALGRSQSAQVYRKSNERNITLELKYIVTGPSLDGEKPNVSPDTPLSRSAKGLDLWDERYIYSYVIRNFRNLVLPNYVQNSYRLAPPIVQVWYGGINNTGASTGVVDRENNDLNDIFPTFRTNWYSVERDSSTRKNLSFRSLWVCKSVGFDYQGGIINRVTKNRVMATVQLQLTEIAPSVTDNEVYLWNSLGLTDT